MLPKFWRHWIAAGIVAAFFLFRRISPKQYTLSKTRRNHKIQKVLQQWNFVSHTF